MSTLADTFLMVDDRIGSKDLIDYFPKGQAAITRLDYGDVAFPGNGPKGKIVMVGVEVKTVSDILQCIVTGRFAGHQLPGLLEMYDHIYLVMEGSYKASHEGVLQVRRGGGWVDIELGGRYFMVRDLESWLITMEMRGCVRYRRTFDRRETASWIWALFRWWNEKEWEKHRSHIVEDRSGRPALLAHPSLARRVAAQIDGVGWEKSGPVEARFKSVRAMVEATEEEWRAIPGIGKVIAHTARCSLNGLKDEQPVIKKRKGKG